MFVDREEFVINEIGVVNLKLLILPSLPSFMFSSQFEAQLETRLRL